MAQELKIAGGSSPPDNGESTAAAPVARERFEYFGWVYHIGVNSIGHEYCHLRFLFIRGRHVEMYKRDPHDYPGIKPIRRGVAGNTLMVEELGRRKVNSGDVYVLRFYNRLDDTKKGEIACATAGEARKWMEAFDHAKQQAEFELSRESNLHFWQFVVDESCVKEISIYLNPFKLINLEGHRPRVRRYARGLKKLIKIGQGPETLLRQSSNIAIHIGSDGYSHGNEVDVIEAHNWKCVRTMNGVRIFEDVAESKSVKSILVKAVGIIDASADTVFEVFLNVDRHQRYEWDMLTGDLELIDSFDGHYDVLYAKYDPGNLTSRSCKKDFVFSRQWFRGQDGTYTILHFPTVHKNCPPKSGYERTKINPSTLEIRNLNINPASNVARCVISQMLEIQSFGRGWWKSDAWSKFEKSVPYALLSQVAGLQEYIRANPSLALTSATATFFHSKSSDSSSNSDPEDADVADEFYDAIATDSSDDEEDKDSKNEIDGKDMKVKLKNVSWAIASLALKRASAPDLNKELDPAVRPIFLDLSHYRGSLRQGTSENDSDCWTSSSGEGFMIRGKTYLKDSCKVMGGEPLLKLISVDWLKVDNFVSNIALHHKSLVQTEAGKKLPFILVVNLGIPAKPNYSLVMYYAADRPVNKNSLLGKFVDGSDMFRDSRFKLIPRIVEGYWMVKRAVGTKACLLGKAVTCKYLRQDNFLEIDVDVGSSSVARSVISLVLGYVTSIVVDLAILIEAKEEAELPEYLLGMVRLNRLKVESAVPLEA